MVRSWLSPISISSVWAAITGAGLVMVPLKAIAQPTIEMEEEESVYSVPIPTHTFRTLPNPPTFSTSFVPDFVPNNCLACAGYPGLTQYNRPKSPNLETFQQSQATFTMAELSNIEGLHDTSVNISNSRALFAPSGLPDIENESLRNELTSSPTNHLTHFSADSLVDHLANSLSNRPATNLTSLPQNTPNTEASDAPWEQGSFSSNFDSVNLDPASIDPELGILRIRPLSGSNSTVIDPELGILRVRTIPPPREKRPSVFLRGTYGFQSGNNILTREDPLGDIILRAGLQLRAIPRVGRRTFLTGSVGANLLKFADFGELDYRDVDLRLGVYHQLTHRAYVDFHWRNHQFFSETGGDRFLNDHQLRLSVGRIDPLTPDLKLHSTYQLQSNWSDPIDRSRLINRFSISLSQDLPSDFSADLFYQLVLTDFTQQERYDSYHLLLAQLQYAVSDTVTFSFFVGGRLGDSTHSLVDFDSTLLGLSLGLNFPLF